MSSKSKKTTTSPSSKKSKKVVSKKKRRADITQTEVKVALKAGQYLPALSTTSSSISLPPLSPMSSRSTEISASPSPNSKTRKLMKMSSAMFKDSHIKENDSVSIERDNGTIRDVTSSPPTTSDHDEENNTRGDNNDETITLKKDTSDDEEEKASSTAKYLKSKKQLLRKLSSFAESLTPHQQDIVSSQECSEKKDMKQMQHDDSKSRRLLRKLSSFTDKCSHEDVQKSECMVDMTNLVLRDHILLKTNNDDVTPIMAKQTSTHKSSSQSAGGILSRLQKSFKFIGNPTKSFAEEEGLEDDDEEEYADNFSRPTVKSAIVKYFQKTNFMNKQVLTTSKPDEEEATIRDILFDQEEAEELETVERIVFSNKRARSRRMSADWRKVQMAIHAIDMLKNPNKSTVETGCTSLTETTRSTTYLTQFSDDSSCSSDSCSNTDSPSARYELENAFFD